MSANAPLQPTLHLWSDKAKNKSKYKHKIYLLKMILFIAPQDDTTITFKVWESANRPIKAIMQLSFIIKFKVNNIGYISAICLCAWVFFLCVQDQYPASRFSSQEVFSQHGSWIFFIGQHKTKSRLNQNTDINC